MPPVNFNEMLIPDLCSDNISGEIKRLMEEKLLKGEKDTTDDCNLSRTFIEESLNYLADIKPAGSNIDKTIVDETFRELLNKFGEF